MIRTAADFWALVWLLAFFGTLVYLATRQIKSTYFPKGTFMPQTSDELRAKWDDGTAHEQLALNFLCKAGLFTEREGYVPTDEDYSALQYLCEEWDYAYQRRPKEHELKTDPDVFQAASVGDKTYELRENDRGFEVGDSLYLRETKYSGAVMRANPTTHPLIYTGRFLKRDITHVLRGPVYGLAEGWAILSFKMRVEL